MNCRRGGGWSSSRRLTAQPSPIAERRLLKHASRWAQAEDIADYVERRLYDGVSTGEIYRITMGRLRRYHPEIAHRRNLRAAISLLRPKPDWELFVRILMAKDGYRVEGNTLLKGEVRGERGRRPTLQRVGGDSP